MKIPGRIAQKALQISALRALTLGVCSATVALTSKYTVVTTQHSHTLLIVSAILISIAAVLISYALLRKFPEELATLSPHLQLPGSIVRRGLNVAEEPIIFWALSSTFKNTLIVATEKRLLQINQRDIGANNWKPLLAALPENKRGNQQTVRASLSSFVLAYGMLCAAVHLLFQMLQQPSEVEAFNLLAQGAFNADLIRLGEIHRTLSYTLLHAKPLHLLMNLFALVLIAQTIGNGFSNATLGAVLAITAIVSGLVGSVLQNFELIVGASGAIMGIFGYLYAAQRANDKRLHPFFRIAGQKMLYLVLVAELVLAMKFSWYGGSMHLAGIATGYGLYLLITYAENTPSWDRWMKGAQLCITGGGLVLLTAWAVQTFQNISEPNSLAQKALASNSPFLMLSASAALPDFTTTTHQDIIEIRQDASERSTSEPIFGWPLGRANYWLGEFEQALTPLRTLTSQHPGSTQLRDLWLAVERDSAANTQLHEPLQTLPAGPAIAYVISANYDTLARLKLGTTPVPVDRALISTPKKTWHLITIAPAITSANSGTYGVWPIPKTSFRTAATANLVEAETH